MSDKRRESYFQAPKQHRQEVRIIRVASFLHIVCVTIPI